MGEGSVLAIAIWLQMIGIAAHRQGVFATLRLWGV